MVIIPKKKAIFENLNSYYVNILKLIEHFQGEVGAGSIFFKSRSLEGVIFFDKDNILNGFYIHKNGDIIGTATVDQLIEDASSSNCSLSLYRIDPEKIYFWSQIHEAKRIYSNLSSEFTELGRLINKMSIEKLTGYFDVTLGEGKEGGLLFFRNGENLGGAYSWGNGELDSTEESLKQLLEKSKAMGGVFHVNKIEVPRENRIARENPSIDEAEEKQSQEEAVGTGFMPDMSNVVYMLEALLNILERIVQGRKSIKDNFTTLLKKKFVEKAYKYDFLDPFAAEFEYINQKITFFGDAPPNELAEGITEAVRELSRELEIKEQFGKETRAWSDKYAKELRQLGVTL